MSKRGKPQTSVRRDPPAPSSVEGKESAPANAQGEPACAPLKPVPKLFAVLLVGFVVWLGVLLTLYFKTVYPLRHGPNAAMPTTTAPS